ncbi:putative outer membrane starch-binding protein [Dysgonomonas alginatilytica]|uniref:Putative outer membrane starch-binding protein n=1 Tax=Dysgonomonas alginatilytica TaxID=1605892 RepID=A0A2V3PM12_9BACT|nr:RagB/SusD family nutrient uptake outer membrane protein [Dysgonomonas alginatilytica]PXV63027.1 putative outer membrane starch-binding protein [Dysgonomonas alginatilytica]
MKKILYIGLLSISVLFVSCSDFLNKEPFEDPSAETINDEASAIALVNGAYQPLQRPKLYNMRIWTLDIVAGNSEVGAGGGTDGIETITLANFVTTTDNAAALDIWRGPNPGILYCNTVLENVPNANISESLRNRCIGEAKFLRAHYFFILVRLFGDVPMALTALKPGDDLLPTRTNKMTIYNDVIIPDLKEAINLLPAREEYKGSNVGRASKGAAAGMLAKVYLTLGMYQECLDMCNLVESLGYTLNPDYSDCFGGEPQNKNTPESLFEVQYYGLTKAGFWDDENQASWLSTYMGPRNSGWVGGAYGWNQPTEEFVSQYEEHDLRKDKTILYEGGPAFDGKQYKKSMSSTGYNVRKFLVPLSVSPDYNTNSASVIVLRYADVLLMKAEALNELGQTKEAQEPLYQVRKRAGLTTRADVEGLNQDQMREKILKERRIELAFEGHRWFDMIRIDNGQYALNFLHSIGKVNATSKHLLFPIPQKERDANPNLSQNTGY